MKCLSCGVEISTKYRFALKKNECPACGKDILKEEDLVLIEELETTILEEINVREESAQILAIELIGKFNISFKNEKPIKAIKQNPNINKETTESVIEDKLPEPTILENVEEKEIISEEERKIMLEKIIKEKYNIDISSVDSGTFNENEEEFNLFDQNDILEIDRLKRIEKQKTNPKSKIKRA
jgi:hypothetical protein